MKKDIRVTEIELNKIKKILNFTRESKENYNKIIDKIPEIENRRYRRIYIKSKEEEMLIKQLSRFVRTESERFNKVFDFIANII